MAIAIHASHWEGDRNEREWRANLRDHAMPTLGSRRIDAITSKDVMAVLTPVWSTKRHTAQRVRRRIGAVMKWAVAQGHREDNSAGEVISAALPNNHVPPQHQKALPHAEVGAALARVRSSGGYPGTVLAFEFLVLTASRSGGDGIVFPSPTGKIPNHSLMATLARELALGAVPHGFRSSFRDWAAECTEAPREVCELALAHVNSDRVEAAYRRSDLFDRRWTLMHQWADYLAASA